MRSPFCRHHTQKASARPAHTGVPADQWPDGISSDTVYIGRSGRGLPGTGAREGWRGVQGHGHTHHIWGWAPLLAEVHAVGAAGLGQAAAVCHRQHSLAGSQPCPGAACVQPGLGVALHGAEAVGAVAVVAVSVVAAANFPTCLGR